jgi:hypothetical protein
MGAKEGMKEEGYQGRKEGRKEGCEGRKGRKEEGCEEGRM